jgi:arylsulfatase A-like enzyme
MKTKIIIVILIALAIAGWFLYNNSGSRRIKHIVLISMDTTRADVLSCYGNTNRTTPNIDALAAEGILFENAIAPAPLTLPSHSTMLTGTTPLYHGVHDNMEYHLDKSQLTLAEILKKKGFSTAAFVGSFMLDSQFGLDQGFDRYDDDLGDEETLSGINERLADDTTKLALSWIDGHHKENMFLFLHYYDPHGDYNPPKPYDSMFTDSFSTSRIHGRWNLYNGEVAYTDHCIGKVIDKLKALKIFNSTLIVVTADHGEMFGEHGEMTHGYFVYRSNIKVPMIFKLPGRSAPLRIKNTVGLVDIVPAICSLMNIELSSPVQGKDISQYFLQDEPVDLQRHIYSESLIATKYKCNSLLALVSDRYKYIQSRRPELYDIIADPLETNNLIAQDPNLLAQEPESKRARMLKGRLQQVIEQTATDGSSSKTEFDEETLARLESLGYVAGGVNEDFSFDQTMTDPKDMITYHAMYSNVESMIKKKDFDRLLEMSEEMISMHPELYQGHFAMGKAAMGKEDYDMAARALKKAIACDPEQYIVHKKLMIVLFKLGRFKQSVFHKKKSMRLKESNLAQTKSGPAELRVLAATQAANGNFSEAVETSRKALKSAMSLGLKQTARDILKEMKLYKSNKPYRE